MRRCPASRVRRRRRRWPTPAAVCVLSFTSIRSHRPSRARARARRQIELRAFLSPVQSNTDQASAREIAPVNATGHYISYFLSLSSTRRRIARRKFIPPLRER